VVDDQPPNRELLRDILEGSGHRVSEAADGTEGLALARSGNPDLILLDVTMPGLDGLEVCRRLKADTATAAIPVVLVTALAEREHRLDGIAAGANDYLTKPIDRAELMLRVRNALQLRQLHTTLAEQFAQLRRLETLRDNLVHMLVHDLRTPLQGIRMSIELLGEHLTSSKAPESITELIAEANAACTQMASMADDVLDASRLENGAMPLARVTTDLAVLANEAVALASVARRRSIIHVTAPAGRVDATCDPAIVRRVIVNLVNNAADFSPPNKPVEVRVSLTAAGAHLEVSDQGAGIPPEYQARIFEKFGQVEAVRQRVIHSIGLGLTFCRLAVEAHGGKIGVESDGRSGSTFWFVLPTAAD
jgi:signal transduction histidine kinase